MILQDSSRACALVNPLHTGRLTRGVVGRTAVRVMSSGLLRSTAAVLL